jgi:hypothetical protein
VKDDNNARNVDTSGRDNPGADLTRDDLLALIPHGSTVDYSTPDRTICVIHDPLGGVVAILSDRTPGPVARRARLIACIPRLLHACPDAVLTEVSARVTAEPDDESNLWGRRYRDAEP